MSRRRPSSLSTDEWPADEEWRVIDGFDGYYEISDRGRIRTWKDKGARRPIRRALAPHLMKPAPNKNGYMQTALTHAGAKRVAAIHTLVAEVFIGPRPDGLVVRHYDGNQLNNHRSNLLYGTRAENAADAFRHGTFPLGEVNGKSKLKADQVQEIRRMLAEGHTRRAIGAEFGISHTNVSSIANGETWQHLPAA
jgi:hypothetical protein